MKCRNCESRWSFYVSSEGKLEHSDSCPRCSNYMDNEMESDDYVDGAHYLDPSHGSQFWTRLEMANFRRPAPWDYRSEREWIVDYERIRDLATKDASPKYVSFVYEVYRRRFDEYKAMLATGRSDHWR